MTHEELLHGRPARISTRSTNHMWRGFARYGTQPACTSQPPVLRARPRERPRRRTVGPGRTDSSYRSRSIFVIRRRSKRNTNGTPPWGARRDAGRTRPRPPRSPLRTLRTRPIRPHDATIPAGAWGAAGTSRSGVRGRRADTKVQLQACAAVEHDLNQYDTNTSKTRYIPDT